MSRTDELLTAGTVLGYLASRGLAASGPVAELGGGVSNIVLAAGDMVVKQALPRLNVADEWLAKRERAVTEARAIELCSSLVPGCAPELIDVDPDACVLIVRRAPDGTRDWKSMLLAGDADADVAASLGRLLAAWHSRTEGDAEVAARFDDHEAFRQLRIEPYYLTTISRRPGLASYIQRYLEPMETTRRCLVHGDYSPKNVLVGPGLLWVIDFEVAHTGDPAFDAAFMLNHLLLKSIHRRDTDYRPCASAFWDAYRDGGPALDPHYVFGHVGCLMLARVAGKSPAEYLTEAGRDAAHNMAASLLHDPVSSPAEAWRRL